MRYISILFLSLFTIFIVVFFFIDYYAVKKPHKKPNISFIIPCYNDGHLIEDCIKSIYASYDPSLFELIVINDCSTDNSVSVIKKMQLVYDFMFIDMPNNIGKSCALNHASTFARYDIISFVDADAEVNPVAFDDVLRRFATDEHIGAVSCPYLPSNMGSAWSYMQDIEYTMLKMIQGSYNTFSALAARGGCLTVRKDAFQQIGGFAPHAITEDMYLALHMNKFGWRVQQSSYQIKSEVPASFKTRLKQKIRRCSGSVQASLEHIRVWIRNPIHVLYTTLIHIVSIFGSIVLFTKLFVFGEMIDVLMSFVDILTFKHGFNLFVSIYGNEVIRNLIQTSIFALFALPYVLFSIKNKQQIRKILLLIPYAVCYMSLYSLVGLYATGLGIYKYMTLEPGKRSW